MFDFLEPISKKASAKIPLEERLRAFIEHRKTGRDLGEIAEELYGKYHLKAPVHPAQGFSATVAMVRRKVKKGDAEMIALCKGLEDEFDTGDSGGRVADGEEE